MGIIVGDEEIGRGILGVRMEFLSEDSDLRAAILERLGEEEDPLEIATSIAVGDVTFNLIDDQKFTFANKLGKRLGEDAKRRYLQAAPELLARNGESGGNRRAFYDWWVVHKDEQLVEEMRDSLGAVLAVGTRIAVAWSPDLAADRDASVSADPDAQPPLLVFHTRRTAPPVETDSSLPMREPFDSEVDTAG